MSSLSSDTNAALSVPLSASDFKPSSGGGSVLLDILGLSPPTSGSPASAKAHQCGEFKYQDVSSHLDRILSKSPYVKNHEDSSSPGSGSMDSGNVCGGGTTKVRRRASMLLSSELERTSSMRLEPSSFDDAYLLRHMRNRAEHLSLGDHGDALSRSTGSPGSDDGGYATFSSARGSLTSNTSEGNHCKTVGANTFSTSATSAVNDGGGIGGSNGDTRNAGGRVDMDVLSDLLRTLSLQHELNSGGAQNAAITSGSTETNSISTATITAGHGGGQVGEQQQQHHCNGGSFLPCCLAQNDNLNILNPGVQSGSLIDRIGYFEPNQAAVAAAGLPDNGVPSTMKANNGAFSMTPGSIVGGESEAEQQRFWQDVHSYVAGSGRFGPSSMANMSPGGCDIRSPSSSFYRSGVGGGGKHSIITHHGDALSLERAARFHRNSAALNDATYTWSGHLPPRSQRNSGLSCKVFLGGVPWDITEAALLVAFKPFGNVRVEWPGKETASVPKGYLYIIFEHEKQVRALLGSCTHDYGGGGSWYHKVSSRRMRSKEVQVIPWVLADSGFVRCHSQRLDPQKTVFVGALHGMLNAEGLCNIFNDLFGGVVYAGIDTDKYKYPIGSARVTFNNYRSYMKAVSAAFIEIKTPKFTKKVQVDPYLGDALCTSCQIRQGPYFCRDLTCFKYFCRSCWELQHEFMTHHKPLMRNCRHNHQNNNNHGGGGGGVHPAAYHGLSFSDRSAPLPLQIGGFE